MMEYIVILHYNTGEVLYKELDDLDNQFLELEDDVEAFFKRYHLNMDECSWMFTSVKPELQELKYEE